MNKIITSFLILLTHVLCHGQDLVVTAVTGPKTFNRYEELLDTITITNTGIVATTDENIYTAIYLSTDQTLGSSDKHLMSLRIGILAAGESKKIPFSNAYGAYANVPVGNYYLIAVADVDDDIYETDETNNRMAVEGYFVNPSDADFYFSSFSLDRDTYYTNDLIKLSYEIRNNGLANLGGSLHAAFYLSTDPIWSSDDKYLWSYSGELKGPDIIKSSQWSTLDIPKVTPGQF